MCKMAKLFITLTILFVKLNSKKKKKIGYFFYVRNYRCYRLCYSNNMFIFAAIFTTF